MHRSLILISAALLVAACASTPGSGSTPLLVTPAASPQPTAGPTPTPGAVPTATLAATPAPTPTVVPGVGLCPTEMPLTVGQFMETDPACFGSATIEIRGWLDGPPDTGFEPPLVEPTWLFLPAADMASLWEIRPVEPNHFCPQTAASCPWFFLHIDPASNLKLEVRPRWVTVTGHVNDPAAQTCHFVYPEGWTEPPLDDAIAVDGCATKLVVDSYEDSP